MLCYWVACVRAYRSVLSCVCVCWRLSGNTEFNFLVSVLCYTLYHNYKHCLSCLNLWRKHTTPTDLLAMQCVPLRPANGVCVCMMMVGIHSHHSTESIKVQNALLVKSVESSSSSSMFSPLRARINIFRLEHLQLINSSRKRKKKINMNNFA